VLGRFVPAGANVRLTRHLVTRALR